MHTLLQANSTGAFLLKLTPVAALTLLVLIVVLIIYFIRYVFKINKMSDDLSEMVRLLKKMNGEETKEES